MPSPDIFASIFSTGDLTEFDATNGSPAVVSSPSPHCGTYCCKCASEGDTVEFQPSSIDEISVRFYLKYSTEPAGGSNELIRNVHLLGNSNSIGRCYMESRAAGKLFRLHIKYPSSADYYYYYDWQVNTWYCIEFYFKKHASTGRYKMWVNDVLVADTGDIDTSGADSVDEVRIGIDWSSGGADPFTTAYVDCICIMDSEPIGTHSSFDNGFEEGDLSAYDAVVGSPSVTELKLHCGSYGCENSISVGGSEGPYINLGHHKEVYLQFEVKFDDATPPTSGRVYFAYIRESSDSVNILSLFIYNDAGTVKWGFTYRAAGASTTVNSAVSTNPSSDTWYCVEAKIIMSSRDGDAEGSYTMYVDDTELNDITQSTKDTDYTGVAVLRLVTYTAAAGGAIVYLDCVKWQDTDVGACHAAGVSEPPTLETETDCTPPASADWLQVYRNCERVYPLGASVESGERGIGNLTIPFGNSAVRGDLFHVIVEGTTILQGHVVSIKKNRSEGTKTLSCQTKSARLYGKYVLNEAHSAYSGEDIGAIAKDLVDYYFDGLFTSNNIVENTGITVSDFDCYDITVGEALEKLANRGNAAFYVDGNNDVHFFVKGDEVSGASFNKDNIFGDLVTDEVGEIIGKVIVKGATGISGEAGSGLPEVLYSDRRISSNSEAQEVAEALLDHYGETETIKFSVNGFFNIKHGQSAILDMPLDGYDSEEVVIEDVSWNLTARICKTIIVLGKHTLKVSYENLLKRIFKEIQEQKVNRISNHSGSDSGYGDPLLEFNNILSRSLASEVRVQTAAVTLDSGTCSSEDDAATLVQIWLYLERGGSGGSGGMLFWIEDGSGYVYGTWFTHIDANNTSHTVNVLLPYDLSGKTLYVKARGIAGNDTWMRSQLEINQFIQHSHDITQASKHRFD